MANFSNSSSRNSMIERARSLADMDTTEFVDDSQWIRWLNIGMSELYDLMVTHFEDYFVKTYQFTTVADQEDYQLPADFYKSTGVDVDENGQKYTLQRYMNRERNRFQYDIYGPTYYGRLYLYRIIDDKIRLVPTPRGEQTIDLHYIPVFLPFSTQPGDNSTFFTGDLTGTRVITNTSVGVTTIEDGAQLANANLGPLPYVTFKQTAPVPLLYIASEHLNTGIVGQTFQLLTNSPINFDVPQGWEELAVLEAAIRAVNREESDSRPLMTQKEQVRQRIINAAADRDAGDPARVVDVSGRYVYGQLGGDLYGY